MNLKGGYKIIDLRTLTLVPSEDGTTLTDITDEKVLEQLDSLKEYLDVSKELKPIYVRVTEHNTVMGELKRDVENNAFILYVIVMGYVLTIGVSFTQDEETLLWSIDEAQYLYVSDELKVTNEVNHAISEGNINVGKTLYKHHITFSGYEGSLLEDTINVSIDVITTISLPFTTDNIIHIVGKDIIGSFEVYLGEEIMYGVSIVYNNYGFYISGLIPVYAPSIWKELEFGSISDYNDTVTIF